ncbi:MAG: tRNA uridine-5-carboxymethylaminomethyl(34) synthesis GTPase MnmE, partial [Defluviitaleaceae bacterium]|nr:tRNA uridine-5-carboxymethylaminomethyl(34) synthesis GTPase MnmE [Defluviitaleaceae bacterium]
IFFGDTPTQDSTPTITNARHAAQINAAQAALTHAQAALAESQCLDLIAIDLSTAHHHLSEITGESATETLLDKIFADFCLGK